MNTLHHHTQTFHERQMLSMKRYILLAALALSLGAVNSTFAQAQTDTNNSVIYACYQKNDGQLRRVDGPGKCKPSEVELQWNAAGIPGPQGAQGQPGAAGQSVTGIPIPPGADCPDGGLMYTSVSGNHFVCNGAKGEKGDQGETPDLSVLFSRLEALEASSARLPDLEARLTLLESQVNGRAYVANSYPGDNNVLVIHMATNTVIASVPLGSSPRDVAINPSGTRAYVTKYKICDPRFGSCSGSDGVSVIDTATNTVIATVALDGPSGVAINPSGTRAYVASSSNTVSVIDTSTNTVVASVTVGSSPNDVAINPSGSHAYVANSYSNNVSVIDTEANTVVATVTVGDKPSGVAVNPSGTRAYVTNEGSGNVSVIDTASNTVVGTVTVGGNPMGVAINPSGTRAYVTHPFSGTVSVIDTATNTRIATAIAGNRPTGIAVK